MKDRLEALFQKEGNIASRLGELNYFGSYGENDRCTKAFYMDRGRYGIKFGRDGLNRWNILVSGLDLNLKCSIRFKCSNKKLYETMLIYVYIISRLILG